MGHKHAIHDSDMHFLIDPVSRIIKNQSSKNTLIRGDHNSERFTFEIQRHIEDHDMSLCDEVEIHYANMSDEDIYPVDDLQVYAEDEDKIVIFSWLVSDNATSNVGTLKFAIHFKCFDDDGTEIYKLRTPAHTVNIDDTIDNADTIEEKYLDVFAKRDAEIKERENSMVEGIEAVTGQEHNDLNEAIETLKGAYNIVDELEAIIDESGVLE